MKERGVLLGISWLYFINPHLVCPPLKQKHTKLGVVYPVVQFDESDTGIDTG